MRRAGRRGALRALLLSLPAGIALRAGTTAAQGRSVTPAPFATTFLQPLAAHRSWSSAEWELLFAELRVLGMNRLILQWTEFDAIAFHPAPLERIVSLAARHRFGVMVGLSHRSDYWQAIDARAADPAGFLGQLRERSLAIARANAGWLRDQPAFVGWYLPEEVDDLNWRVPARRDRLQSHLAETAEVLKALTPDHRVAVSGFANRGTDPEGLAAMWSDLLAAAPGLDEVWFQDGVGVGKLDLAELEPMLRAVAGAVRRAGRELRVIVETFTQVAGAPLDADPFKAVPAPLARVLAQLTLAARWAAEPIAFSAPEYMTPWGGVAAGELGLDYLEWRAGRP